MSADMYIASGILELYVAGVLSPAEMEEVRLMAEKHERIAEEIKRIEETHMQYAALHAPLLSNGFAGRLLDRIAELPVEETVIPETGSKRSQQAKIKEKEKEKAAAARTVKMQHAKETGREVRRSPRRFYMVITATLFLLAISALLNFYLYQQWQAAQNEVMALRSQNTAVSEQYNKVKLENEKAFSQLSIYADADNRRVVLKGLPVSAQSAALVFWNSKSKDVYLQVKNLPQPPAGKQYQLWAIDENDKPVSAGVLNNIDESRISQMNTIISAKAFAITLEPEGGSMQPTPDAMYVMGNI